MKPHGESIERKDTWVVSDMVLWGGLRSPRTEKQFNKMIERIELLHVVKVDTFDGRTYEAALKCLNREDGLTFVGLMNERTKLTGYEVTGFAFKPMAHIEEVAVDKIVVQREYHISQGIFVTFKTKEEDMSYAMTGLLADIDSVIR